MSLKPKSNQDQHSTRVEATYLESELETGDDVTIPEEEGEGEGASVSETGFAASGQQNSSTV